MLVSLAPATMNKAPDDVLRLILEACSRLARARTLRPTVEEPLFLCLKLEVMVPLVARSVCRRFRAITDSSSALWTTVTDRMPPEVYRRYLALSKQHGLTIVIEGLEEEKDEDQEAFLRVVLRERHRWLCMFVGFPNGHIGDERLPATDDRHFPMLEMVVAVGERARTKSGLLVLDQDFLLSDWSTPRLASALFCNIMTRGPVANTLATLHVNLVDKMIHPKRLWSALAGCHVLGTLRVSCRRWIRFMDVFDTDEALEPLELASVRTFTLVLQEMFPSDCDWLFRAFRFPGLSRFSVNIIDAVRVLTAQQWAAQAFAPGRVGYAATLKHVVFELNNSEGDAEPAPTLVETLFQDKTFGALTHLEFGHNTFGVLEATAASGLPGLAPFAHFPRALAVLDLSKVACVAFHALLRLLVSLVDAHSRATVRLRKGSLHDESDPRAHSQDLFETVTELCAEAIRKGQMEFELEWVEVFEPTRPLKLIVVDFDVA